MNQRVDPLVTSGFNLDEETMLSNPCDEDAYCSTEMDVTVPMSSVESAHGHEYMHNCSNPQRLYNCTVVGLQGRVSCAPT